jgi:hypothetical protein
MDLSSSPQISKLDHSPNYLSAEYKAFFVSLEARPQQKMAEWARFWQKMAELDPRRHQEMAELYPRRQ